MRHRLTGELCSSRADRIRAKRASDRFIRDLIAAGEHRPISLTFVEGTPIWLRPETYSGCGSPADMCAEMEHM